jgi:hypothetical protein
LARDVNDDGKLDLVVVNAFSTVTVLYGNGNGTFQNPEYFAAGFGLRSLSVADVNGDGTLDILTADELFDEVSVLLRQWFMQMRWRDHGPERLEEILNERKAVGWDELSDEDFSRLFGAGHPVKVRSVGLTGHIMP